MAQTKLNHLLIAVAAFLLVGATLTQPAEARGPVNPFCRTSSRPQLCTRMVLGARNWNEASLNAIRATIAVAKRRQNMVAKMNTVVAGLPKISRDSILSTCAEDFEMTVSNLETSMKALAAKDTGSLVSELSAAYGSDCELTMEEFGLQYPLSKITKNLQKHVNNCLAVVQQT